MSSVCQGQGCNKKPTLAYNRYMRFFPHDSRVYCEDCFTSLQRREDLIFIGILFGILFLIVALIFGIQWINTQRLEDQQKAIQAYFDAKDLNRDGRVDSWEETATDHMHKNFKNYGYPWEKVLSSANDSGSRLRFMVYRPYFEKLSKQEDFFKNYHFIDLMKKYYEQLTDPNSQMQAEVLDLDPP